MSAPLTPLQRTVLNALVVQSWAHAQFGNDEWKSTKDIHAAVEYGTERSWPLSDIAAALRALKRAGLVESRSLGTSGKAWRIKEGA